MSMASEDWSYLSIYESIPENSIRLLILRPGSLSDPLQAEIETHHLPDKTSPSSLPFEALSYTWGEPIFPKSILCRLRTNRYPRRFRSADSSALRIRPNLSQKSVLRRHATLLESSSQDSPALPTSLPAYVRVPITQNLFNALVEIRHLTETRTLWIDAICIDQKDEKEKSSQIRLMRTIYRVARHVIVWLGLEDETTEKALQMLYFVATAACREEDAEVSSKGTGRYNEEFMQQVGLAPPWHDEWRPVFTFFKREWFSRVWTRQEVLFARSVVVFIGKHRPSWDLLCMAVWFLKKQNLLEVGIERMDMWHSRNALRRYLKVNIEDALFSLSATLKLTRELKSSDPRDAVYGILGTAMNSEVIKVDYSKTLREVLVETAHCLIFSPDDVTHPLTILYEADHPGKPKQPEIPSWVPRWHEPEQCHGTYSSNGNNDAGGALNYDLKKLQGTSYTDNLRVSGYVLDIISTKSDFSCPPSEAEKGFFGVLLALPSLMDPPDSTYITGESALEVYAQTSTLGENFHSAHYGSMLGGFLAEAAQQGLNDNRIESMLLQYWGIFENWAHNIDEFDEIVGDEALDWAAEFMSSVHTGFRNRHAFRTNRGYLGVGPSSFLPGDQVCVLFGSRVPFILREMEDNMFSFIGSCYVHGIMHGETLEDGCKMSRDFILR